MVNGLNSLIRKFDKDGKYISGFGVKGDGPSESDMPWVLTIDNIGHVYVSDWNNYRIQEFCSDASIRWPLGPAKSRVLLPKAVLLKCTLWSEISASLPMILTIPRVWLAIEASS